MVWINCIAGGSAFQQAERLAKEHNGFSVDAESYKGIRPALAIYSEFIDFLKSGDSFSSIYDNYTGVTRDYYLDNYCTQVNHKGYTFWVRAYYYDNIGWFLVNEGLAKKPSVDDLVNSYTVLTDFDELSVKTQKLLMDKYNAAINPSSTDNKQ